MNTKKNKGQKFVAYYRVSTKKQGRSGLGLEAQQATVKDKIKCEGGQLLKEFTEVESGKRNDRPALKEALELCKKEGATLIIAKLDRLSRNVEFIFSLRNSKVDFLCCDLPELNTLTLGVYASVAQYERERIVERIKDALKAKKARGCKLGSPANLTDISREKSKESRHKTAIEHNQQTGNIIRDLFLQKLSYRKIAAKLNEYGLKTASGKAFAVSSVQYLKKMYEIAA